MTTFECYRLVLLALSYNLFEEIELKQVVTANDAKDFFQFIEHSEAMLVFDLNCFYAKPVLVDCYKRCEACPLFTGLFNAHEVHDEKKSQVQDLWELIGAKQQIHLYSPYKRIKVLFWIFVGLVASITPRDSHTVWTSQTLLDTFNILTVTM